MYIKDRAPLPSKSVFSSSKKLTNVSGNRDLTNVILLATPDPWLFTK